MVGVGRHARCEGEGFAGGALACNADCTLDTSNCTTCGNGVVEGAEACDGADLGASTTCADVMLGTANEPLACNADCTYDFSACGACGDGMLTAPEECEGADLGGQDCVALGFDEGTLACSAGCTFDTSGCVVCGDAVKAGNEECDGADLGSLTCADFSSPNMVPFEGGTLACTDTCTADTSNCMLCGDGVVSGMEVCESGILQGETCETQGFDAGVLACNAACDGYDTSACTQCGDGFVEGNEQCEGMDLAGESCSSLGFVGGGTLACTAGCLFDTNGCTNDFCGDAIVNANDACDCGNQGANCTAAQLDNETCVSQGFSGGTLKCNSPNNCMFDTSACFTCGDGMVNVGEVCDGNNLNGQTCASQGFGGGGTLSCSNACQFNTSQCLNVTSVCANPNTAIPNQGNGTASNIMIAAGGTVRDVNISIVANHTNVGDLNWVLSRNGASNRVMINRVLNGTGTCTGDNINVTLDDEAGGGSVQAVCNVNPPAINGTRTPSQTLAAYDNQSMIATWTLTPSDAAAQNGGTFVQWCIDIAWN